MTKFNLTSLMKTHKVTIRDLAARMGVSLKRVREVRGMSRVNYVTACDYTQAVTGVSVFSRARFDAMCRQAPTIQVEDYSD